MTQQQFQLNQKINEILPKLAEKYGKEIEIENYKVLYLKENDETEIGDCIIGSYINYISNTGDLMTVGEQGGIATTISHDWIVKIEAPQIRQILLALQDVLGENPEYTQMQILKNKYADVTNVLYPAVIVEEYRIKANMLAKKIAYEILLEKAVVYYSEALCKKWVDTLTPLVDREPVTVLTEFLEVLENLNNQ